MSLCATIEEIFEGGQVGDWAFTKGDTHIAIVLTPNDDGVAILPIGANASRPSWVWDGNREAPTLTPSILHHSKPEWHGWMRAGKLVLA